MLSPAERFHHPHDEPLYSDHAHLLQVYNGGQMQPVTTPEAWQKRRAHILAAMQQVMGPLPDESKKVEADVRISGTEELPLFTRIKLDFAVEAGDRLPAYLLMPRDRAQKVPAVLCLHQTTSIGKAEPAGVGGLPNLHYAAHLAERGYVTLAPDYSLYPKSDVSAEYRIDVEPLGYSSGTMKGIWNHMRAVDLLQSLPEVDGTRIGCIGHSLGGHNSLFLAAFDERIKVVVSSCGFTAFPRYESGDLSAWGQPCYMPRVVTAYGGDVDKVPFDFTEIVAALAPRAFFASAPTGDDNFDVTGVQDCITAAAPVYELLGVPEKLAAIYPVCGHDFPEEAREEAYAWVDRWNEGPKNGV